MDYKKVIQGSLCEEYVMERIRELEKQNAWLEMEVRRFEKKADGLEKIIKMVSKFASTKKSTYDGHWYISFENAYSERHPEEYVALKDAFGLKEEEEEQCS